MTIAEKLTNIAENSQNLYEAGRQAEQSKAWERITGNGTRTDFTRAFFGCDYSGIEFSKPVAPTGTVNQCFDQYKGTSLPKNLDFSNAQLSSGHLSNMFKDAKSLIAVYDLKLPMPTGKHFYTFYGCNVLETIENLRSREETVWEKCFYDCYAIADINIIGTIGQNGFDIHWSTKLSKASLKSILLACNKANAGVTITLPSKCIDGTVDTAALISGGTDSYLTGYWVTAQSNGYTIAYA